mgnify:CR=1 FL=1
MNNIEQIENIYRHYYNKPVLREACGPIFTSSPKEYGQYLQNKKTQKKMSKVTAMERIQKIRIDVEWRSHGRIPRKVVRKWLNDIQKELE